VRTLAVAALFAVTAAVAPTLQRPSLDPENPAIQYSTAELHDPAAELNRKLAAGSAKLDFDKAFGYLASLLAALSVPVESQIMVFSKTSLQSMLISPENPRAIYFNDGVTVGFVRGGPILEVAAQDPKAGIVFYTLDQSRQDDPSLTRETVCLSCHNTAPTLDVPGVLARTVFPGITGAVVNGLVGSEVDHRVPFDERWGGWYVTGKSAPARHLANALVAAVHDAATDGHINAPKPAPLRPQFPTTGYPAAYSDVVALTVFEHQMHMMNLITRTGWEARLGLSNLNDSIAELVDYLLFVDEAPLISSGIEGTSGFAEMFAKQGPFDSKGRSLRQLDLDRRLMRYPCSYMIYSSAFNALPASAKDAIYRRMWEILSGQATESKYAALSAGQRKAVIEILRDTLPGLPAYFKPAAA